jgi:hypothetical protein
MLRRLQHRPNLQLARSISACDLSTLPFLEGRRKSFASDPTMGLWRNEQDKVSIQLTEDKYNIVIIYVKFSMVTDEIAARALSRAFENEEQVLEQ